MTGTRLFVGGMAVLVLLVLLLRWVAGRSEDEGDSYLEDTYGSNRRPSGVEFFPRYLQRYGGEEPDDRPCHGPAAGGPVCSP